MQLAAAAGNRGVMSLDGLWDFVHASDGLARKARVPMPWQADFADLRQVSGDATYRRSFRLPPGMAGRIFLCFGAVSYRATVAVNGAVLITHDNGWLPFEVEIPAALLRAENTVTVACHLPGGTEDGDLPFAEIPHGKQTWYGPSGGIWQSVRVESRPDRHLTHVAISADPATGRVAALIEETGSGPRRLTVAGPDGRVVATGPGDLTVADPLLWSPDAPHLYRLTVDLGGDVTHHTFGFREIRTEGGRILLNGKPFYMRGALDQDYYPQTLATAPSLAFLEDQARKARELGLNTLRCHIKVPDPRYYDVADRFGLLIWTEIPNVATFSPDAASRMRATMEGILRRDGNHPSVAILTIVNEDWGTRLCEDPGHRSWLKAEYDWLKQRAPGHLVVDNSPCHGNFHVKTDINDYHYYRTIPERREEWDALTAEFAGGADWAWSHWGDAERRGTEPLIVSEFGTWGLPQPAETRHGDAEPWWTETGQLWGEGCAYPHGMEGRFDAMGLSATFGSLAGFVEQAQWYQFRNLKYQIESMRGHAPIQGYVITEFTDVQWEANGLLDMNRNPRVFHEVFANINADVVIVPRVDRYAGRAGAGLAFGVAVATGGASVGAGELHWSCGAASGVIAMPAAGPAEVVELGDIGLTLPAVAENARVTVALRLVCDGVQLAANAVDLSVYAPRKAPGIAVDVPDAALADWFRGQGYAVAPDAPVTVARSLDAADIARMQGGARYLVIADGIDKTNRNLRRDPLRREQPALRIVDDIPGLPQNPDGQMPNIGLAPRDGTMWRGDWISSFSWIRRAGPLAAIPGGPVLDESFDRVVPRHVLTGFRAHEYAGKVHAGLVVGWVHKPAALIAERKVGKGGLVATTFRIAADAPGADPVAAVLADALVALAAGQV